MNIKPIRTKKDYELACKRIDEIFQAEPGSPEDDELDILATLVDAYEQKHFPIGMPHPIEAIKIQMEAHGVTRKHLMEWLGKSSGRISDLLNCRRALTLEAIRVLSARLYIPERVLTQDYEINGAATSKGCGYVAQSAAHC
ncbi:MAG: helix-turn-helix domain-containing protein [Desulfomonilaceae bacterium]